MMKNNNIPESPAEKFQFIGVDAKLHDQKFETKQISYFRDAFRRRAWTNSFRQGNRQEQPREPIN